jgi:hypothetical protein
MSKALLVAGCFFFCLWLGDVAGICSNILMKENVATVEKSET